MTLGGWEEGRGLVQNDVAEMSDRFDAIRSAEMMGTPDRWPLGSMLPLRRMASRDAQGPGSLHEHGHLLRADDSACDRSSTGTRA